MAGSNLTSARLRELLHYNPETGQFRRLITTSANAIAGAIAGSNFMGYLSVSVAKRHYLCHRLAWLYMTGEWPQFTVDHIDGSRSNNRWDNLRDVPHRTNIQNERKARTSNKSSGLLGVAPNGKRWMAQIRLGGKKSEYLGTFDTPEEAHHAYLTAKRAHHEGCTI